MGLPAFGWAKPVPVNPYNLRNPRRDNLVISAAGPLSNFLVAAGSLVFLLILKFASPGVNYFLKSRELTRAALPQGFFPLEGLAWILYWAILINIYLAVFNLIPLPPLDGSGVLMGLLSDEAAQKYERIRPFSILIVLALIYLGVLDMIIFMINLFLSLLLR
jgi:Zn-dependent protease